MRINAPDTAADIELRSLLDGAQLNGFVVLAGAGSGKTTSLVKALDHVATKHGSRLKARTQRVACITYTEVAAMEIHADVGNSPLVAVSTIHSFLWSLASPFQKDIAKWVRARVEDNIKEIIERQSRYSTRTRQKTIDKEAAALEKLQMQLGLLGDVERYSYRTASNYGKGELGHEDVLSMVPELILANQLLAKVVASKYPYIFVDESQDTFPNVVRALKHVSAHAKGAVCLGFFGDPMQQIYQRSAGSISLEPGWVSIQKPENFRSSDRVLSVINTVRSDGDGLLQVSGRSTENRLEGECFFFVLPADDRRSKNLELVQGWLESHSKAGRWRADTAPEEDGAKILMITHRMAAKRMGFEQLYSAFHDSKSESLSKSFDEGTAWPLRPFEDVILPIFAADSADSPSVIRILRESGGALSSVSSETDVRESLAQAREAVEQLRKTVESAGSGSVGAALKIAVEAGLFLPDPRLSAYLAPAGTSAESVLKDSVLETLDDFVACDVSELPAYFRYIRQQSPYSTQHGTKGSEFRKVIVVLDDDEGKYNLYSYEKMFGIKPLSATDQAKADAGEESVLERTRRLLYVCVSRAVESLAVVLFARDVDAAGTALEVAGLVNEGEILTVDDLAEVMS
ncbi:UvrD-helicase domain-containing protein [Streptomyces sp. ATMOS53]